MQAIISVDTSINLCSTFSW